MPANSATAPATTDNLRASVMMVMAMAGFSVEDVCIKLAATEVPIAQMMAMMSLAGSLTFGAIIVGLRQPFFSVSMASRPFVVRSVTDIISGVAGGISLTLLPLSIAGAILQAMPILVTLGAALFLGERVGWRRWSAVLAGLAGMLLILKPGTASFQPAMLLAVLAVVSLAGRDLATRATPAAISTLQMVFWGNALFVPVVVVVAMLDGKALVWPSLHASALIGTAFMFGIVFYYTLLLALRLGDASAIVPFRYTRLVFAMVFGFIVFSERPDIASLAGSALVVAAGLYVFARERQLSRRGDNPVPSPPSTQPL